MKESLLFGKSSVDENSVPSSSEARIGNTAPKPNSLILLFLIISSLTSLMIVDSSFISASEEKEPLRIKTSD